VLHEVWQRHTAAARPGRLAAGHNEDAVLVEHLRHEVVVTELLCTTTEHEIDRSLAEWTILGC
jgi:hypothetical protein